MKLEDIGFYTLCEDRARNVSPVSPMWRCELILTTACNFKCPYCRPLRSECQGTISLGDAKEALRLWANDGLRNVRFSGGEPTLYPHLPDLVSYCREKGVRRIAVSTNGSASLAVYERLLRAGVNDFSVSLDACCSDDVQRMSGGRASLDVIEQSIRFLAQNSYVTVGVVLTSENEGHVLDTVSYARSLGVHDVRVITAAQHNAALPAFSEEKMPILRYRAQRAKLGLGVRGLSPSDCHRCYLAIDDSVIAQKYHFPCVIHMREGGNPIGRVGPYMRQDRIAWSERHDTHKDPICKSNCLDVCVDYNNRVEHYRRECGT